MTRVLLSYDDYQMLRFPCECGARPKQWCTEKQYWWRRRKGPPVRPAKRLHPDRFFQAERARLVVMAQGEPG